MLFIWSVNPSKSLNIPIFLVNQFVILEFPVIKFIDDATNLFTAETEEYKTALINGCWVLLVWLWWIRLGTPAAIAAESSIKAVELLAWTWRIL